MIYDEQQSRNVRQSMPLNKSPLHDLLKIWDFRSFEHNRLFENKNEENKRERVTD